MKTPKVRKMKTLAKSGECLNHDLNTTVAVKNFSPKCKAFSKAGPPD